MFRRLKIWFIAAAAIIVLMFAGSYLRSSLDSEIKRDKLIDLEAVQGLPPEVALATTALGGFRGLVADVLWLRVNALQQSGKYFELVQLSSWITKLQPNFTGGTAFLAWNMAYNISVTFQSHEDRWRWVQRGIELIRDEALNYNPSDPELYQQLGWIYQHKMGNTYDDAQRFYKYQIAREMMNTFGGKPDADWEALAAAPKTMYEFKKAHPSKELWDSVAKAGYPDDASLTSAFRMTGKLPESLVSGLGMQDAADLENFLRAQWLRQAYKIRPETVLKINRQYGALDWRIPESFAIYWSTLGIEYSPSGKSIKCDRMISQALMESFKAGKMLLPGDEATLDYILIPNLNIVDSVRAFYQGAYDRNTGGGQITFKNALDNFMIDAIVTMYAYGRESKAREYFNDMRKERKGQAHFQNFDKFVLKEWTEDIRNGTYKQAHEYISGLILTSCILLAYNDRDAAESHMKLARLVYATFETSFKDMERNKLPPFDTMKKEVVETTIQNFPKLANRLKAEIRDDTLSRDKNTTDTAKGDKK